MSILPTQTGTYFRQDSDPLWASVRALYHFDGPSTLTANQTIISGVPTNSAVINPLPALVANGNVDWRIDRVKWGISSILYRGIGYHSTTLTAIGSQDFTLEYWFSRNGTSSGEVYAMMGLGVAGAGGFHIRISSHKVEFWIGTNTSATIISATSYSDTNWHHLAVSRTGTTTRLYVDGIQIGSTTALGSLTATQLFLGAYDNSGSLKANNFMEEFRLTVGTGRYTTTPFTVPDLPYSMPDQPVFGNTSFAAPGGTAVSWPFEARSPVGKTLTYSLQSGTLPTGITLNTSTGILSGTLPANAGSYDVNTTVTIRASDGFVYIDQPIIITNQAIDAQWSNVSLLIPGNDANGTVVTDYGPAKRPALSSAAGALITTNTTSKWYSTAAWPGVTANGRGFAFFDNSDGSMSMSGDFTAEAWIYPTAVSSAFNSILASYNGNTADDTILYINASAQLSIYVGGGGVTVGGTVAANQWSHVAWTRQGTSNRVFLNGTLVGTITTYTGTFGKTSQSVTVGGYQQNQANIFTGYINDVRITKGVARYTANFTAPTGPFPRLGASTQSPQWVTTVGAIGGATVGKPFSYALKAISSNGSGTLSYSIQSGALPTGLTLDSSTGVISGTPTVSILTDTTYSFTVRATLGSVTLDRAFTMQVYNDDPLFNNVFTVFQFIGANGAAPVENTGKSAFSRSGAALSTAQFKWATSSAFLNGASNFYTVTPAVAGQFNGDFTIETWIRPTAAGTTSNTGYIFSAAAATSDIHSLNIGLVGNNMTANWLGGSLTSTGNLVTYNNWHHLAAVRQNGVLTLYINGVSVASGAYTGLPATTASNQYTIGCLKTGTATYNLNAYLNDYRVTFGARYTGSSFTVPTFQIPLH